MTNVLDSFQIKSLSLQSRIVRSATAERLPLNDEEEVRALGEQYAALALGGVGLIVTGHIAAQPNGRISLLMPGLWDETQVDAWREVVRIAHEAGAVLVAQINHGGGRCPLDVDAHPIRVSETPEREKDAMQGKTLTTDGIEQLIADIASAALRAREAGMDGVQIHAAHGYLGSQFLSPQTNHRDDEYGGDIEGRARYLRRVVQAVRAAVGDDYPIGMKLGACDSDPDGLTIDDTLIAAKWFEQDGLDFIEISGAFHADIAKRKVKPGKDEAYYAPFARQFKQALSIPVIAVGGFRSLDAMNATLDNGDADMIALSRPLISQPDLPRALANGHDADCVSCSLCMFNNDTPTACHYKLRKQAKAKATS